MKNRAEKIKIKEMAEKYGMSVEHITRIIGSQTQFIRDKTRDLNIDPNLTREEFDKLKTNFNIPAIGKLHASFYLYKKMNTNNGRRTIKDN